MARPPHLPDYELVKEAPPNLRDGSPGKRGPVNLLYKNLLDLLRDPGEWYRVATFGADKRDSADTTASALRNGRRPVPEGRFEFKVGKLDDDRWGLWARCVPDEPADDDEPAD